MTEIHHQPAWQKLLFASATEIAAAPADVREDYFRFVDGLSARPEDFGMRHIADGDFVDDDVADGRLAASDHDWVA